MQHATVSVHQIQHGSHSTAPIVCVKQRAVLSAKLYFVCLFTKSPLILDFTSSDKKNIYD